MRDYRIFQGLFFNEDDRILLRERIRNTEAGAGFVRALEKELQEEDKKEYKRLRFDWYAYNPDIDHGLSVENYQNINGIVAPALKGPAHRSYLRTLAYELLDKKEYREGIREDMLRLAEEYPLHLFVMADMGLILYGFLKEFLFVLDAERDLFSEEEQWRLDGFARGVAMDIIYEQEEWLRSEVGKQHCNNHMVAHSLAAIFAGLYYHRQDWVKYGLENPEGIYTYLEDGMTDAGMGTEASLTYNLLSLVLMMEAAEVLKRADHPVDLFHKENSRGYSLRSYFETAMNCLTTDGRILPIGDNYAKATWLCDMEVFYRACTAYGEELPALAWLAKRSSGDSISLHRLKMTEPEKLTKPDSHSCFYEKFGIAVLKSVEGPDYWDSDALALAVRTGYGFIHGNCDHMAMLLFRGSDYVIQDFEGKDNLSKHVFSGHITRTLNRSRLAHSAVMVNGMDTHAMRDCALLTQWQQGEGWQRIVMEDRDCRLYDGVWQKRTLLLEKDTLTDIYEVKCDRECDIDYIVHFGDDNAKPAFAKNEDLLAEWFPEAWPNETLAWMRDPEEIEAEGGLRAEAPGISMQLRAQDAHKGLSFGLPKADDLSMGASRSYLLRVHGKYARFEGKYECQGPKA